MTPTDLLPHSLRNLQQPRCLLLLQTWLDRFFLETRPRLLTFKATELAALAHAFGIGHVGPPRQWMNQVRTSLSTTALHLRVVIAMPKLSESNTGHQHSAKARDAFETCMESLCHCRLLKREECCLEGPLNRAMQMGAIILILVSGSW